MWPIFGLNLVLGVLVVWAVRRVERRAAALEHLTASLRDDVVSSIRAELARPTPAPSAVPTPPDAWTPQKNARRSDLIDREIDEVITPDEARELEALQEEAARYARRVAPRPLEALEALHQQLLEKAAKAGKA